VTRFALALSLFGALAACSKKEGTGDNAGDKAGKTAEPAASGKAPADDGKYPPAFAAWDMGTRKAAWQGAWAGEGGALGRKAAWEITGNKIRMLDKNGEKQLELEVTSPCTAKLVEKSDGGSSSTTAVFTLENGQLITGLGSAGSKKGDTAVVCGSGKVFTLDAKGCTVWEDNFGKIESSPGECGFAKDGDKDVFTYKSSGMESTLLVEGDVIWSEQLKKTHAAKHPSFDAAKQAQGL
jgi:hypothetical protein